MSTVTNPSGTLPRLPVGGHPAVVDEVNVRLVAGLTLVVGLVAMASGQWWMYAGLALDFLFRTVLGPAASPLSLLVKHVIRPRINAVDRPTGWAPKRFAAGIGAAMTLALTGLWVTHLLTGTAAALTAIWVIALIMALFPALEAFLGLCVGCKVFAGLARLGLVREEVCLDCSRPTAVTAGEPRLPTQEATNDGRS